jgi:two-component system, OmpR family, phosphate regulon sensor histidine kinase PhoR
MARKRIWIYAAILFILSASILATQSMWIVQSARIEESFLNQRVNMALCSAMDVLSKDKGICSAQESCSSQGSGTFQLTLSNQKKQKIDSVIAQHLLFYNISVPFHTTLSPYAKDESKKLSSNQALLFPISNKALQNIVVQIEIPSKNQLIRSQINGTFILSIVLLMLLIGVFISAIRSLSRERRIRKETVDFINTMAHDLKTPISNISFALALFNRENPQLNVSSSQYISIIDSETDRLKQRARQILGAASVDAVLEDEAVKTEVNIHELIKSSLDCFALRVKEMKANISVKLDARQAGVVGSPVQLSSAVINIIDNAINYSGDTPEVRIRTENAGDSISIEIADNGPGIPEEEQALIFMKGYRIRNSKNSTEGFGLGLYLAKTLVEKQGGRLSLFSDGNHGSKFTIELPVSG